MPGIHCATPDAAFYAFANCAALIGKTTPAGRYLASDEDVALALLEEAQVAVVHGSAFGLGPYLRIAYALDAPSLLAACAAMARFCRALIRQSSMHLHLT